MLAFLLAVVLSVVPASRLFAQEDGGGEQDSAQEGGGDQGGGDQGGADEGGGDQGGGDQGGGDQGGGDQGGGDQGGGDQGGGDQGGGAQTAGASNIVGDIAADNEPDPDLPAPKPKAKKAKKAKLSKIEKAGPATVKSGRLKRRRGIASKVGEPAQATAEAEPQFPELDLPELKAAAPKKEPAPPLAPLVALNAALP